MGWSVNTSEPLELAKWTGFGGVGGEREREKRETEKERKYSWSRLEWSGGMVWESQGKAEELEAGNPSGKVRSEVLAEVGCPPCTVLRGTCAGEKPWLFQESES